MQPFPSPPGGPQGAQLSLERQLIGNHDEVTDVRFVGPSAAPSHVAVATNGAVVRLFELATMSCAASLAGHRDIVLCMDAFRHAPKGSEKSEPRDFVVSGAKDNEVSIAACHQATLAWLGLGNALLRYWS